MTTDAPKFSIKTLTGSKIYTCGDICNHEDTGVITKVESCEWNGLKITVMLDGDFHGEAGRELILSPNDFEVDNSGRARFELID